MMHSRTSATSGTRSCLQCKNPLILDVHWARTISSRACIAYASSGGQDPYSSTNLGQLTKFAGTASQEDLSWAYNRVSPDSFANRGLYVDYPVVLVSAFLLITLLAVTFQRVLGLDKIVADFLMAQQEQKRQDIMDARQRLERSWNDEDGPSPPGADVNKKR